MKPETEIFELAETVLSYPSIDDIPDDVIDSLSATCEVIMMERNMDDMEHEREFYGTGGI